MKSGIAAAHILAATFLFSPKQMLAIVPNSMLYSERDANVREVLRKRYSMEVLASLGSGTFANADVSVSLIELATRAARVEVSKESRRADAASGGR